MMRLKPVMAALLSLGALLPCGARAADTDAAALRAELEALKSDYAQRVSALESRIARLEAGSAPAPAVTTTLPVAAAPAVAPAPANAPASSKGAGSAFNPAISMILAGNYASTSESPATYRIAGFIPSGGDVGPGERSFNLDESELTVAANVDPYFFANVTAALDAAGEVSVEEAYFRTLSLPQGLSLKGGRFFSGLGYLNEVHAHAWDFVDQPLVYQAFFGSQLDQDGVQLKWLAPTDTFIELGAELGNGASFPGTHRDRNGMNATTLFTHVGGDIGDSSSWRVGASWLDDHADAREYEDTDAAGLPVVNAFTGSSRTWIADAILKWAPHGDSVRRQLKLQGEYMHRTEDGVLAFDTTGQSLAGDYRSSQSGWYVQGVYLFRPRWRAGLRYDSLDSGTPDIGLVSSGALPPDAFPVLAPATPDRITVMLDWSPSEFSRLRAQYAWDNARADQEDHQFLLQYLYGIGAHGAHKF